MSQVCIVTGSRADYGLLRPLMEAVAKAEALEMKLIVTGAHLSSRHGHTVDEILRDGIPIAAEVELPLKSDSGFGMAKSIGIGVSGFADAYMRLAPDLVVLLGDRYEIFAAASAAAALRIPIGHIHGGEITEGSIDELFRHAITKLSQLHFTAHEVYRQRIIQMGESPDRVFAVGALGLDRMRQIPMLSQEQLTLDLDVVFSERNLVITFHPETIHVGFAADQTAELLCALERQENTSLFFTLANADPEGQVINSLIAEFVARRDRAWAFASLGSQRYLSLVATADGVVGNSSSGLIEVPSLGKGTVNIGDRQRGRLRMESVIDCEPTCESICDALDHLYSEDFQQLVRLGSNPLDLGGASSKIVDVITSCGSLSPRKEFHTFGLDALDLSTPQRGDFTDPRVWPDEP